jgi:hypothetical protein
LEFRPELIFHIGAESGEMVFAIRAGSEGTNLERFGIFQQHRCAGHGLAGRSGYQALNRSRGVFVGMLVGRFRGAWQSAAQNRDQT